MNKVKLRLELDKLRELGDCGPNCGSFATAIQGRHCFFSYTAPEDHIYPAISKCKITAMVFRSREGLDEIYEKDKTLLENLQYSTKRECITCANVVCFKTHAKGLPGPCKYWKPQILLDYPEISDKIKLEGVTKHPKKVGQIGYSFTGSMSKVKDLEISVSIGTFKRGTNGGSYVYKMYSKEITTRPYFYTLEEFGY